jgi:hypothetical protein
MTVQFGLVELDLLATHTGIAFPFPLRVPSFGRIPGERSVLFAAAGRALEHRGLADDRGPAGFAAEVVTALREHRGTVDLVVTDTDGTRGVVALLCRSWALLCGRRMDEEVVWFRRVPETALVPSLCDLVPAADPARAMPVVLSAAEARSGSPEVLDRLATVVPAVTGRGQLGATRRRGDRDVRTGAELSWVDGPLGRVRLDPADNGGVSINPLRERGVRSAVEHLVGVARAA